MVFELIQHWLVVQILGLLALPVTMSLFRSLPDSGYAFSKSLGILLTGYIAWLAAMLHLGSFSVPLLVFSGLAIGVWSVLLYRSRIKQQHVDQSESQPITRSTLSWTRILSYEIIFLSAFIGMAWMRSMEVNFFAPNPNPWFTERPMDFAFFNAIQKSAVFPPADPWLSGYSINYYYFGYLLMAIVTMLSRVTPGVGYNLSLALIFALTALNIVGILTNLIDLTRNNKQHPLRQKTVTGRTASVFSTVSQVCVAVFGAILVLGAANQVGALQVVIGSERVAALDGPQLLSALQQSLLGTEQIKLPYPAHTTKFDFDTFTAIERRDMIADFNWWWPSRALWDEYPQTDPTQGAAPIRYYVITEFPFFSFWLGDMHPHVMSLPFSLLAIAAAAATISRHNTTSFALNRQGWQDLILTGIILGSLYTINSWDLPTYVLLYSGALLLLFARQAEGCLTAVNWGYFSRQLIIVLVAIIVLFAPFYLTFHSLVGSATPLINIPLIGKLTQTIAPFHIDKSGLHAFLIIFGLFVVPLITFTYLSSQGEKAHTDSPIDQQPSTRTLGIVARFSSHSIGSRSLRFLPWFPVLLLIGGLLIGFPLLGLFGLGIFAFQRAVRNVWQPAESFVLLMIVLGCAICFGVELIYIRDVFEGASRRMNTIFKFYYQVWLLWGSMTAYALWWLFTHTRGMRRIGASLIGMVFVIFLAGSLVYPIINLLNMATKGIHVGLNGHTPRENTPAGKAAIAWMRVNAESDAVILEMVGPHGGSYNSEGYAGVSASVGLPTVLGWLGHEQQWRGGDKAARSELTSRQTDVELIYSTTEPEQARTLLKQYNVSYIYVGELERQQYLLESLAKFDVIARPVFKQDDVTIYKTVP